MFSFLKQKRSERRERESIGGIWGRSGEGRAGEMQINVIVHIMM